MNARAFSVGVLMFVWVLGRTSLQISTPAFLFYLVERIYMPSVWLIYV